MWRPKLFLVGVCPLRCTVIFLQYTFVPRLLVCSYGYLQSTDVSRLKSRWMQAIQPGLPALGHTMAATVQRPQSHSISATKPTGDMASPLSPLDGLGGGRREGEFHPGMLNLDVTPPLGAVPLVYRGDVSSAGRSSALGHDTAEDAGNFRRAFQQEQQPAPPLISEPNPTGPLQTVYLQRRQLVFGGGCEEGHDSRENYEGQALGSEDEPQVLSKTRFKGR